jgi:hypothetical protein
MSFAKKSVKKEDVKQSGSAYITQSGIYPVEVLAAFVDTNESDSSVVNFFVEHEGQQQVIYGNLRVTNNGGEENVIGMKTFNQLLVIGDIDECADPVEMELPIGKDSSDKTVAVLEDLSDVTIMMRVQLEYSNYNNVIRESKVIKGFYRAEDSATAEEIVNDKDFGTGFEKDQKYVDNITYKDDLTADDITAWVANGRKGGTGASSAGSAATATKTPAFGNKKKFGKK